MNRITLFEKELDKEAVTTRKMLAVVPNDKYDWKPHPKSMSIRQLATHVAELPAWISMVLHTTQLDFAANPYQPATFNDTAGLLKHFEESLADGKAVLNKATEANLDEEWTLRNGEQVYSTDPKSDVIRMTLSQIIHHRAQLGVFLRLLDVPIPGSYGPSADDQNF